MVACPWQRNGQIAAARTGNGNSASPRHSKVRAAERTALRMIKTITVALASLTIVVIPGGATASATAISKTVVYGFGNHQVG
jgi:hypothetical protein